MRKALWIIWLAVVWFFAMVAHGVALDLGGIKWMLELLGIFWLFYLAGLWLEDIWAHYTRVTDTAWAMLLGYAIGMIRLLDNLPHQQEIVRWLRYVPKFVVMGAALAFILIFVGILPLIAKNVIASHKAKNRVLGRDY